MRKISELFFQSAGHFCTWAQEYADQGMCRGTNIGRKVRVVIGINE
jgi:hypothetical protein